MTLSNDRAFWSSAGSLTQIAYEALTFELSGPACRVVALQLAPYRALYQEGWVAGYHRCGGERVVVRLACQELCKLVLHHIDGSLRSPLPQLPRPHSLGTLSFFCCFSYPVYPPMRLQVWVGPTPHTLQPASPWHDVQASDALQTFALWDSAPIGRSVLWGGGGARRTDCQ